MSPAATEHPFDDPPHGGSSARPGTDRPQRIHLRPTALVLIALQVLVPSTLLVVRHLEPERGQLPFGWQMHTDCWGDANRCR